MAAVMCVAIVLTAFGGLAWLDRHYPPAFEPDEDYSVEVLDRHAQHLRIFNNQAGRLRLKTDLHSVDQSFIKMLIAYEDKRFFVHPGVDPLALLRAAGHDDAEQGCKLERVEEHRRATLAPGTDRYAIRSEALSRWDRLLARRIAGLRRRSAPRTAEPLGGIERRALMPRRLQVSTPAGITPS